MEAFEPKWVNPDYINMRLTHLYLEASKYKLNDCFFSQIRFEYMSKE